MSLTQMQRWFANPWALWLPMLLPLLTAAAFWAARRRRRALARLGGIAGLTALVAARDWLNPVRGLCLSLGLTVLALGIAGPQWGRDYTQVASGRDIVVVLDLSRSMHAEVPSRLERAKLSLGELAERVETRGGHRLALVVFAGQSKVVCPLTHDYDHFRAVVGEVDLKRVPPDLGPESESASGTRIGLGLREAVALHDERFAGAQDIVLVSDGDDPARDGEWRNGVAAARDRGIPAYAIGLGNPGEANLIPTENGPLLNAKGEEVRTRLEEEPLREIARLTGGSYTPAQAKAIPWDELLRTRVEPRSLREDGIDALAVYRQHYGWFLAAALIFLGSETLWGRGWRRLAQPAAAPAVAMEAEVQP